MEDTTEITGGTGKVTGWVLTQVDDVDANKGDKKGEGAMRQRTSQEAEPKYQPWSF